MADRISTPARGRGLAGMLLAGCALWLVAQNTALLAAWLWWDEARALRVVAEIVLRVVAKAGAQLWPVAGVVVATLVIAVIAMVLLSDPRRPHEVRHG